MDGHNGGGVEGAGGWRGVLTSSDSKLDTMVVFDTRDGSVEIKATVKLDMGPILLELSAAVGRCRLAVSKPVSKAPMVSALEIES